MPPVLRKRKCEESAPVWSVKKSKPTPKAGPKPDTKSTIKPTRKPPVRSTQKKQEPTAESIPPKPPAKSKRRSKKDVQPPRQKAPADQAPAAKREEKENKTRIHLQPPSAAVPRVGKRKRDTKPQTDGDDQARPTKIGRLTEGNLRALAMANGQKPPKGAPNDFRNPSGAPSDITSTLRSTLDTDASKKKQTSVKAIVQLKAHRIHPARALVKPSEIDELIKTIQSPFDNDEDDDSEMVGEAVSQLYNDTRLLAETQAQQVLQDWLGYRAYVERRFPDMQPGEDKVSRMYDQKWSLKCVPIVAPENADNQRHAEQLRRVGHPTDPKPDIGYGYTDDAFEYELDRLGQWRTVLVTNKAPWFPYWVVEWKASCKATNISQAEVQARRDGAAAVASLYDFYHYMGAQNPAPEHTAMFSMCVDSENAYMHIHWRRVDPVTKFVSYEMSPVYDGLLKRPKSMSNMRSVIRRILEWARGPRLQRILDTMYEHPNALPPKKGLGDAAGEVEEVEEVAEVGNELSIEEEGLEQPSHEPCLQEITNFHDGKENRAEHAFADLDPALEDTQCFNPQITDAEYEVMLRNIRKIPRGELSALLTQAKGLSTIAPEQMTTGAEVVRSRSIHSSSTATVRPRKTRSRSPQSRKQAPIRSRSTRNTRSKAVKQAA